MHPHRPVHTLCFCSLIFACYAWCGNATAQDHLPDGDMIDVDMPDIDIPDGVLRKI